MLHLKCKDFKVKFVRTLDFGICRDFVEISDVTYQKLDELKVVTQPVKIIRTLDPFKPKIEQCE